MQKENQLPVTEEAFIANIQEAINGAEEKLGDLTRTEILGYNDGSPTLNRRKNVPGSGLYLYTANRLEELYRKNPGVEGVIYIHKYCEYLYVGLGITDIASQEAYIETFLAEVERLNKLYCNTTYQVVIEEQGSAKPYMIYS